ncbi:MAG: tRNA uridine-5-carboxymethylaminomethyl(34) synthesis GTPase MnmE [Prevotella sp.]|nr:tRNA uridine-5-carboxymethylaminomethyl(34) synthesis GTPase MnmE [Prevotella sp.]
MIASDNICAIATAIGGAIGVIRVSGPEAVDIVAGVFSKDISQAKGYTMHHGYIEGIDEVIVTVCRAPHSYTGEDTVEISCHGSAYILSQVLNLLVEKGCRLAGPGEFTKRAYLNGKMDLSQAEAVADVIASQTAVQHRVAMQQMRGGISSKLQVLRDELLHLTSLLELELDFSDHEELEFADRTELEKLADTINNEIQRLSSSFREGNAIKNGIPVAIIGAPNVGKSTLLNALLHDDRAIVSDIQGTTRDLIEDTMTIGGYLFRFIDTAGIRNTDDAIEQMGIERSLKAAEKAQIIILLADEKSPFPDIQEKEHQQIVYVINKSDKLKSDHQNLHSALEISALHGSGIKELEERLLSIATSSSNAGADEVIITNQRHKQALDTAAADIQRAMQSMHMGLSGDLISEDLRLCINHLSDILGGTITTNEVLGNIFKNFCVGK